jgi:hypothetical protein
MKQQGTCEQRLEAAFVSLAPRDLEGLGASLRDDAAARERYERLAAIDLALAQSGDEFAVLGPLESRVASSFESLQEFFSPTAQELQATTRPWARATRWALAAAAVLLAVLLPLGTERGVRDIDQPGIWSPRGDRAAYLRPYCVDHEGRHVDIAVLEPGIAICDADQLLLLTAALRADEGAWLHAVALPHGDGEPLWIVPNPVQDEPEWVAPADRPVEAWAPVDLSVNYQPGTYQMLWAMCSEPIPWAEWAHAADRGSEGVESLLDTRDDCEQGTWLLVIEEVAP